VAPPEPYLTTPEQNNMDSLTTAIVDLLRKKKETEALNRGGVTVPAVRPGLLPRATEPKHGGKSYDDIVTEMSR
jgi:hypothetical protein